MNIKIGDSNPRKWIPMILVGFILQYVWGGGIPGTIGLIFSLVGLGNFTYYVCEKTKYSRGVKITLAIVVFFASLFAYAFIGFAVGSTLGTIESS